MKKYTVQGIHCEQCAHSLELKLKELNNGIQVELDYGTGQLLLPENVDVAAAKKVLGSDKVWLFSSKDEEAADVFSHPEEQHQHSHGKKDSHSHNHGHDHGAANIAKSGKAARNIKIVFFLNLVFALLEFVFGFLFNSAAIISDAVHDAGDSLSVGLAWFFQYYSAKEANARYSFGHRRFSLLGALITSVVLLVGSILVVIHSFPLLFNPEPVNSQGMLGLSVFAIVMNGYAAWLLSKGSSQNESVLNLHMLEDVLGWVGVLVVSIVLMFTDWYILDPILSIFIAIYIFIQTIPKFVKAVRVFLEAVPEEVDLAKLEKDIRHLSGVHSVSHLHFWSIDGEENALAVTLYMETYDVQRHEEVKDAIRYLTRDYNVTHSTIEVVLDEEKLIK